jgi:hypothetical protein
MAKVDLRIYGTDCAEEIASLIAADMGGIVARRAVGDCADMRSGIASGGLRDLAGRVGS